MTIIYEAGFDAANLYGGAAFSMTLTRSGKTNAPVGSAQILAADTALGGPGVTCAFHTDEIYSSVAMAPVNIVGVQFPFIDEWSASTFPALLKKAMDTAVSGAGWTGTPTFTVSMTANLYKITISDAATFGITFANASTRNLIGFSANQSGATTYTAAYNPYYYVVAELSELSSMSDVYEPGDVADLAVADDGTVQDAVSRTLSPWYLDWTQEFEPKRKVFNYSADTSTNDIFTYSEIFRTARTVYPIMVTGSHIESSGTPIKLIGYLRPEGSNFAPVRAHPHYDDYWHIPFKMIWVSFAT